MIKQTMYKRYSEPSSEIGLTKYMAKKLKLKERIKEEKLRENQPIISGLETLLNNENRNDNEILIHSQDECEYSGAEDEINDVCDNKESEVENINDSQATEFLDEDVDCDDFFEELNDNLIHPNLSCKTAEAILMILEFFLRHRLTWVALEGLLKLFHSVLGDQSQLPKTKYFFKKVFGNKQQAIFHFYCKNCTLYIDSLDNLKETNTKDEGSECKLSCPNCLQTFSLHKMNEGHFFIQLPLKEQIINKIVKIPEILEYNTTASSDNSIRDIFDGRLYKSLKQKIGDGKLITLTMNTDGVKIFKSTRKGSLWPIQMYINEVSPRQRFKLKNIILNGIWFGKDPDFALYMKPLTDELDELDRDKIQVNINNMSYDITTRGFVMTTDSVARCKLKKLKQYNGKYGCTYCLHPGNVADGSKVSKFHLSPNDYCLRTHSSTLKLMKEFLTTGKGSYGVTGISPLIGIKDYDLIRGTPIDYMHCVLLGVVCLLLALWFDSSNHFQSYYITPRAREYVNKNISFLQGLKGFHKARSVDEKEQWKANECRNWLLYFAIPCLKDSLKDVYLKHFTLLSEAIFIFLKTNISTSDFKKATDNLKDFVEKFEILYGKENMMYNVHLLEHLAQCVLDLGPLWAYSNFCFESNNGSLSKHVKGSTDVEYQILSKYFYNNVLENLKSNIEGEGNYVELSGNTRLNSSKKLGLITLLGSSRNEKLNPNEQLLLRKDNILGYTKFFFLDTVYYSSSYKKVKVTNDTIVSLKDGTFGQITRIYEDDGIAYVLLKKFKTESVSFFPNHIKKVCSDSIVEYNDLKTVRADEISEKCVLISTAKDTYISLVPNNFESD